jgi:hypothetical protein
VPQPRRQPRALYAKEHVGFDVERDPAVNGHHIASESYVGGQAVSPDEARWHTLFKGMKVARKDGYDFMVWSEPVAPA